MVEWLHPSLVFFAAALLVPLCPVPVRRALLLAAPLIAFALLWRLTPQASLPYELFGFELNLLRVDGLGRAFGVVFTLNALAAFLFALTRGSLGQHCAALVYIGASLGAVLAGDLISLYLFWEVMAVASTFIILARKTPQSFQAGLRYILVHLFGGLCLLAGMLLHLAQGGGVEFALLATQGAAAWLILLGFLVNVAAFPFSAWLSDAYPQATATGAVILTAYTTKTAVYALVRGFAGWEVLILIGAVMALFGVIYALLENHLRRMLAFALISQNGIMVAGVGVGSALALNGAIAYALVCILYMGLLWMTAGAVEEQTGRSRLSELGGLRTAMPLTFACAVVGALTIASFPGLGGFVSKPMILKGAAYGGHYWGWLALEFAAAGVVLHASLRYLLEIFFGPAPAKPATDPPGHMLAAMGLLAAACIGLGLFPQALYALLPYEAKFVPYTFEQALNQLQLLAGAALGYLLLRSRLRAPAGLTLDTDWLYRKGGQSFYQLAENVFNSLNVWGERYFLRRMPELLTRFFARPGTQLLGMVWLPVLQMQGKKPEELKGEAEFLERRGRHGSYPVGGGVLLSVLFIALMTVLYFFF